jgi:tetratricopeptide (TPR) repeat protein
MPEIASQQKPPSSIQQWLSRHATILAVCLLVVVAATLRLYRLNDRGLWMDEIFTAVFAAPDKTLAEVAAGPLHSPLPTPPLWFWITHLFMWLFGSSDVVTRLPSVIAGSLGVLAIYKVGATLFDRDVGLVSALLLTLSPVHLYYSREARFYAALVLFSLLTFYYLHQAITTAEEKWWLGFALATLVNLYIHLAAFFVLAAEIVYVGLSLAHHFHTTHRKLPEPHCSPGESTPRPAPSRIYQFFLLALLFVGLCYLPMAPYLLTGVRGGRGLGGGAEAMQELNLSPAYFVGMFVYFGAGSGIPFALYVGTALWGLASVIRSHTRQVVLFLLVICLPYLLVLIVQPRHWFMYKYVIAILPVYLLAVALGITHVAQAMAQTISQAIPGRLWTRPRKAPDPRAGVDRPTSSAHHPRRAHVYLLSVVAWVLVFSLVTLPSLRRVYSQHADRWQRIGQLLNYNAQPQDVVAVMPLEILTMSAREILGHYGPSAEISMVTVATVAQMQALLETHRRVWVVKDWSVDLERAAEAMAWLDAQPHVKLMFRDADEDADVFYLGQAQTQLALLEEVQRFPVLTAEVYASVAEAYYALEMRQEAIAAYKQTIALDPSQANWHYLLALRYDEWGEPDAALAEYQAAIGLQSEVPDFHAALGAFYARNDLAEPAIDAYQTAIRLYLDQHRGAGHSYYVLLWRSAIRTLEASMGGRGGD